MATLTSLTEVALSLAVGELGVAEVGRNSGPRVEEYLRSVGLEPGQPWCASFLFWLFERAARRLRLSNPVPKTGSSLRVWELSDREIRDPNPKPGYVYVLDHGQGHGHVGIVESLDALGNVDWEISGNTRATTGGRDGDRVARHHGTPEVSHGPAVLLGYLAFDLAVNRPLTT